MDEASIAAEPRPDLACSWCCTARTINAADQRLLTAYAAHFAVLEERRRAEQDAVRTRELDKGTDQDRVAGRRVA